MKPAIPWIPADALRSDRAARPTADAVAAWADHWFAGGAWSAATRYQPAALDDWSLLRQETAFRLSGKPKAMLALAFALLGRPPRTDLTDIDLSLLRRLAARAIDDLVGRIDAALPSGPESRETAGGTQWQLTIGPAARPVLAILVDEPTLAVMARRSFPAARRPGPLAPVRHAVDDIEVPLSVHIGSTQLAIEQIKRLEVGDLLLFDQRAETAVRLAVADRPSSLHFAIGDADDRLTLTMQES